MKTIEKEKSLTLTEKWLLRDATTRQVKGYAETKEEIIDSPDCIVEKGNVWLNEDGDVYFLKK